MRQYYFLVALILLGAIAHATGGDGVPVRNISSCEIDLNNDHEPDTVILAETHSGSELIALMRTSSGYDAYIISRNKKNMSLSCHFGSTVTETKAGPGQRVGKVFTTPGTYIQLKEAEGSAVVYFWVGNKFQEVWTAD